MNYFVYILFSTTLDSYYIGFTSDISARLIRHNKKGKGFTGKVNDWKFVYQEEFSIKEHALKRERQLKNWKSRKKIIELIAGSVHPD